MSENAWAFFEYFKLLVVFEFDQFLLDRQRRKEIFDRSQQKMYLLF